MSRSSRKKERHGILEDNCNEERAARTRPFSFDEIMLRRKNNKQSGDVEDVPGGAGNSILPTLVKHDSDDFVKVTSRKKEDDTSVEEQISEKGNIKSRHSVSSKATPSKNSTGDETKGGKTDTHVHGKRKGYVRSGEDSAPDKNNSVDKAKGGNTDGRVHGKRKSDVWSSDDFQKKHAIGILPRDTYEKKSRGKPEKESKRKHRDEDEERSRRKDVGKKYDSGKWVDSELPERKLKEPSQFRCEDSRLKRRRSRSRENEKDRGRWLSREHENDGVEGQGAESMRKTGRRSRSREHEKNRSRRSRSREHEKDRGRRSRSKEHEKDGGRRSTSLSPRAHKHISYDLREHEELHSSEYRSGRFHSVVDRKRISTNGSSSQYRRLEANRLGGYSPRKRRTEAAVKTPSPTNRSPENKNAIGDLQSVGKESNFAGSVIHDFAVSGSICIL